MRAVLPLIPALSLILIAPGALFYFDVTPKVVGTLLLASVALFLWNGELPVRSKQGRLFMLAVGLQLGALVLSCCLSVNPALSLNGGNWRRFGAITQVGLLIFGVLVAADAGRSAARVQTYLRLLVVSGLVVALYGIAQYFSWDPIFPRAAYESGEAPWTIVRPPSTLGHADYFAVVLVFVTFASLALLASGGMWKVLGSITSAVSFLAIVLSGTRAALLGLAIGAAILAFQMGWSAPLKQFARASLVALCILGLLMFSPAGSALKNRLHWVQEEPLGGGRLLLWRDTLRMSLARPLNGFGAETFQSSFPQHESGRLARLFPDFEHESPHNIFLDSLIAGGILGLLAFAAFCACGFRAVALTGRPAGLESAVLGAALAGGLAAQQFTAFVLPTALLFTLMVALLNGNQRSPVACSIVCPLSLSLRWICRSCRLLPVLREAADL